MYETALQGLGIVHAYDDRFHRWIGEGRLKRVLADWSPGFSGLFLYYPSRRHPQPALRAFIDCLGGPGQRQPLAGMTSSFFSPSLPELALAPRARRCHQRAMASDPGFTRAGGALLALSILAGALIGVFLGQPSIGFLAGAGIGLVLLAFVWLADRKRG
jgi:hypothetical protein